MLALALRSPSSLEVNQRAALAADNAPRILYRSQGITTERGHYFLRCV
jgi:hypothetical protein